MIVAFCGAVSLCGLLLLINATEASADTNVPSGVVSQPNSPVKIDECNAYFSDTHRGKSNYYLEEAVGFTNLSDKTVVFIEFRFDMIDGFNGVLGSRLGPKSGTYSPNVPIQVRRDPSVDFSEVNIWPSLAGVRCSVSRVEFSDGTIWNAP